MTVTIKIARSTTIFPPVATVGELFVDITAGILYCWNGTTWANITSTGATGVAGQGTPGPIGAPGAVGPTAAGPVGPPGIPG